MLVYFAVFERHENKDLSVATPSNPSPCVELRDCFEAVTRTKIFSNPIFFLVRPKMNFNEVDLRRDITELLNLRLSKLPSTKTLLKLEFDTEDQVL